MHTCASEFFGVCTYNWYMGVYVCTVHVHVYVCVGVCVCVCVFVCVCVHMFVCTRNGLHCFRNPFMIPSECTAGVQTIL